QAVCSPNERKRAMRLQKPRSRANPPRQQSGRANMREAATRVGRDILAPGVVEWWIHQNAIDRVACEPAPPQHLQFFFVESNRSHPVVQAIQPRVFRREQAQGRVDFDQSHLQFWNAGRESKTGSANSRSEVNGMLAGTRTGRCRQNDRVMPDAMAA